MKTNILLPDPAISFFVKNIITIESDDEKMHTLPFFADGYPGVIFQQTVKGLFVLPQNKKMPDLFLYGQTLHPIELKIEGKFKLIVFQLYPFVIKSFFDVEPHSLNDSCYDLAEMKNFNINEEIVALRKKINFSHWEKQLSKLLHRIFEARKEKLDHIIQKSILKIIETNGLLPIKALIKLLPVSERTFERRFTTQVGVTPKQFSKIIQFQNSLNDLQQNEFNKLTDVVYKNGFADQSHFIKVFKAFTGFTPAGYKAISS